MTLNLHWNGNNIYRIPNGVYLYVCMYICVGLGIGKNVLCCVLSRELCGIKNIVCYNYSSVDCYNRLEPYICEPELILSDPAGIPYMESDTQPPVTMAASEDDEVYSSLEDQYAVAMDTKNVMHKVERTPSNKPSQERHDNRSPELVTMGDNLVNDLVEASMTDSTLQATPTSQEGVVSSSSSAVMNTLSNLWTSAWGSWQS